MTPEERRNCNKEYYANNKKAILTNKILNKEKCGTCGREVAHQKMKKHNKKSNICRGNRNTAEVKKQMVDLTNRLKSALEITPKTEPSLKV